MLVVVDQLDHLRTDILRARTDVRYPARRTLIDHDEKSGVVPAADVAPFIQ
jgi:hypothetical protein